jgi:hypothetical protein
MIGIISNSRNFVYIADCCLSGKKLSLVSGLAYLDSFIYIIPNKSILLYIIMSNIEKRRA